MNQILQISLKGEVLEIFQRPPVVWLEGSGGWPLYSQAFVCPWCLELWAMLTLQGEHSGHEILPVPCLQCPSWGNHIPGSILENYACDFDQELLSVLPQTLLEREFFLTLSYFEGKPCESTSMQKKPPTELSLSKSTPQTESSLESDSTSNSRSESQSPAATLSNTADPSSTLQETMTPQL